MLLELHIKNFALIDTVDLEFSNGLNMLTGETGAGKSILIDSINFILGSKQSRDIIRTGHEQAYVEGVFDIDNEVVSNILNENGIDIEDILIISREINQSGRSISRINGKTVTVGFVRTIGKHLIDLHGQHEHQSLLDEGNHIEILDSYCGEELFETKAKYKECYQTIKEIEKELNKLTSDEQHKLRRIDLLTYQIQEISETNLEINEDEELTRRKNILTNSEKIFTNLSSAYQRLYEAEEKQNAYDEIGTSIVNIESISKYDPKLQEIKGSLEEVYYKLEDAIEAIRDFRDAIEFNTEELDEIELRLDVINKLKRKYGSTLEDILKYYETIKNELFQIERSEEIINELNLKLQKYYRTLSNYADAIGNIRKDQALKLKSLIEKEIQHLGMEKAIFKIEVIDKENFDENGKNHVFFTMTANPGEALKPLSKVASGGEISRIMLAIKSVIADIDMIPTLIFDEIDTGISGRTAQSVAEKMVVLSKNHQILCVSHLPQITSMADYHFKIKKQIKNDKTTTDVRRLITEEQIDELARILGGAVVTELTRKHAKEMLDLADSLKNKIRI
jgi:DNA repair protein RecN (Recombination protein N)